MAIAESTILQLIANAREQAAQILTQARSEINVAMGAAIGLGADDIKNPLPVISFDVPTPGDPGDVPVFTGRGFTDPGLTATQAPLQTVPGLDASGSPGTAPILQIARDIDLDTGAPGDAPVPVPLPPLNLAGDPGVQRPLAELPGLDLSGAPGIVPSVVGFVDPGGQPTGAPGDVTLIQDTPDVNFDVNTGEAPDLMAEIRRLVAPPLVPIVIPDAPDYQPQQFLGVQPVDPGEPPSATTLATTMRSEFDISATMRAAISTDVDSLIARYCPRYAGAMATLEARLATYLNGGTALSTAVQNAIAARVSARTDAEYRRSRYTIGSQMAQLGHSLPSPMMQAALRENDNTRRDANAAGERDNAVKMAELEQNNIQFAVTQSATLRAQFINAAISYAGTTVQVNGQAVQYAREVVGSIVQAYDLSTKRSEIQARIYEAETRVYEAKVEGALAVLKAYESKVHGLEAQANVDTALVNVYKARIDAIRAEADVYRAQVDGAVARSGLEKLKVDLYQARVQAFTAQTNAWSAQWTGYKAAVDGRIAGVQASVEQVKGYTAQSENYRTIIQARSMAIDAVAKSNEANQRQFSAAMDGYKTVIGARTAASDFIARTNEAYQRSYGLTIDAYRARIGAQATASESVGRSNESASRSYGSSVNAYEAVIRARSIVIDGIAKSNEAGSRQFVNAVEAYRARVGALSDVNKAEIASFDATLDSYRAKANAISEKSRAEISRYEASLRAVVASSEMIFRLIHEKHDLDIHRVGAMAQLAAASANNYGRAAESALSGLNSLVSVSDSTD